MEAGACKLDPWQQTQHLYISINYLTGIYVCHFFCHHRMGGAAKTIITISVSAPSISAHKLHAEL